MRWQHGSAIICLEYAPATVNYLAHLYLADRTCTSLAGSLLGDIVRGPLNGQFPAVVEQGIRLHRKIDSFTDAHLIVRAAKARFRSPYRRYAGILLDVLFDHYLATNWAAFDSNPLPVFIERAHQELLRESTALAEPGLVLRLSYMRTSNLLLSYRELSGVGRAYQGLSTRLSRKNPLHSGLVAIEPIYKELQADFMAFFPSLIQFSDEAAS